MQSMYWMGVRFRGAEAGEDGGAAVQVGSGSASARAGVRPAVRLGLRRLEVLGGQVVAATPSESWPWLSKPVPDWNPGKWKHGPTPL